MKTELDIVLELPNRKLQPNRIVSLHWAAKGKLVREAKLYAALEAKQQIKRSKPDGLPWPKVRIDPVFFFRTRRERDKDNLIGWLKSYIDALQGLVYENDHVVDPGSPVTRGGMPEEIVVLHISRIE